MSKQLINTKTLTDIARHSNKIIRLSRFLSETETPFLFDKMNYLEKDADAYDLMMALDSDLGTTVNMIKSVALMVESLDKNHKAPELKSEESDFSKLFPEHYNPNNQTLSLFGVNISASDRLSKTENLSVKEMLYNQAFKETKGDYPFSAYRKHLSILKSLEKSGRPKVGAPFEDVLKYANMSSSLLKWRPFYDSALTMVGDFHELRNGLNPKDKKLVDDRVYSGRAMIYGVVKTSTYISKESGIEQISSKHKDKKNTLQKVLGLVKQINCITAVEIDQDTSLEKFHDILVDVKRMQLDVPDAFELKSRKLGNYKLCGVHAVLKGEAVSLIPEMGYASEELKIVAVDMESPTSLAHEITHFRDQKDDNSRSLFIEHFSEKIDREKLEEILPPSKVSYIFNPREVIARLGEIGFLLNQFEFNENESPQDFFKRVKKAESEIKDDSDKLEYNVDIVKSITDYLSENNPVNSEVYFNLSEWEPSELMMVKDYVHGFFFAPDPSIQQRLEDRIASGELDYQSRKYHQKHGKRSVRRSFSEDEKVGMTFSKINPEELLATYQYGVSDKLFSDGEFMYQLSKHHTRLGEKGGRRGKRSINLPGFESQIHGLLKLAEQLDPGQRPADALIFQDFASKAIENMQAIKQNEVDPKLREQRLSRNLMSHLMKQQTDVYWENDSESRLERYENLPRADVLGRSAWVFRNSGTVTVGMEKIRESGQKISAQLGRLNQAYKASPSAFNESHKMGQWYWLQNNFLETFSESNALPISIGSEKHALAGAQLMNHVLSMSSKDIKEQSNLLVSAGLAELPIGRELMAVLQPYEKDVSNMLVEQGWLERFNIDEPSIARFIEETVDAMPLEQDGTNWKWVGLGHFAKEPDAKEKLTNFLGVLLNHPSHEGEHSGRNPKKYSVSDTMPVRSYSLGVTKESLSPLSALISLTSSYSGSAWEDISKHFKKSLEQWMETPEIDSAIDQALSELSENYLMTRSVKERAGGISMLSLQNPLTQYVHQVFFDTDTEKGDLGKRPTKLLKSALKENMLNEMLRLGRGNRGTLRVRVNRESPLKSNMAILADEDSYKILKKSAISDIVNIAVERLKIGTPENAWIPTGKNLPVEDVEKTERKLVEWIDRNSGFPNEMIDGMLQAATALSFNQASLTPSNSEDAIQLNVCRDLMNASEAVTAPWLVKNTLGGDCRARVELMREKARLENTHEGPKKAIETPSTQPKIEDEKPEPIKPNNKDVPAADDRPLRPENQLRLL